MTPARRLAKIASLLRGMRTRNRKWEGAGYIGIDWTPIRIKRLREITRLVGLDYNTRSMRREVKEWGRRKRKLK